jgi:hypothetical protein
MSAEGCLIIFYADPAIGALQQEIFEVLMMKSAILVYG